jgi:hypothetical protein
VTSGPIYLPPSSASFRSPVSNARGGPLSRFPSPEISSGTRLALDQLTASAGNQLKRKRTHESDPPFSVSRDRGLPRGGQHGAHQVNHCPPHPVGTHRTPGKCPLPSWSFAPDGRDPNGCRSGGIASKAVVFKVASKKSNPTLALRIPPSVRGSQVLGVPDKPASPRPDMHWPGGSPPRPSRPSGLPGMKPGDH